MNKEPIYHDIGDALPEGHELAYECLYCEKCREMIHASNNEFMQPWFETDEENYCFKCFGEKYV